MLRLVKEHHFRYRRGTWEFKIRDEYMHALDRYGTMLMDIFQVPRALQAVWLVNSLTSFIFFVGNLDETSSASKRPDRGSARACRRGEFNKLKLSIGLLTSPSRHGLVAESVLESGFLGCGL